MSDKPKEKADYSDQYDRVMTRLRDQLETAEYQSWDFLQARIEEAVELELAAEEMTRDEMDLLAAYIKRDLKKLGFYAHETGEGIAAWLNFDLNVLEHQIGVQLMDLADRTRIGLAELEQRSLQDTLYLAGETAGAGTFRCLACGTDNRLTRASRLTSCLVCGGERFARHSAPWEGLSEG